MRYVLLYLLLLISAFSFPTAFAQHHGGEQAPPISFGDKKVTVGAILNPPDFIPGKNTMANL
ncbi:MAG: peptidase, partial [Candidatus Nitrosotenuis sp.]